MEVPISPFVTEAFAIYRVALLLPCFNKWQRGRTGCNSSDLALVKGKVTLNGKPVPNGTVNFIPDNPGPSATGELKPDGTYALTTNKLDDGAKLGTYKVVIVAMEDQSGKLPEEKSPLPAAIVPLKYTSLATTELTATVEKKENTIDFELKK